MARRKPPEPAEGDPRYMHIREGDELDPTKYNRRHMPGHVIITPCRVLKVRHKGKTTLLTVMTDTGPSDFTAEWFNPISR